MFTVTFLKLQFGSKVQGVDLYTTLNSTFHLEFYQTRGANRLNTQVITHGILNSSAYNITTISLTIET